MVDIIKQDMTDIWASSGDVTAPNPAKIATGWVVEAVPRQWWNWFENRQDTNIAYMLQKGIPEWDTFTEYLNNKSYVQRNNVVYKCIQTGVNKDPATQTAYWTKAFPESSDSLEALRTLTPAADRVAYYTGADTAAWMTVTAFARTLLDDANVTTMRTTLGAQASHANLTALSGATAATNTFPYWNSATTMLASSITAFGRSLIDDADNTAARTTLGLGTAAVATVTTSTTDATTGRLLKVGDFGFGGASILVTDLDAVLVTGFYRAGSGATGQPVAGNGTFIHNQAVNPTLASQIYFDTVSGKVYYRTKNTTWAAWSASASVADVYAQLAEFGIGQAQLTQVANLNDPAVTGINSFVIATPNAPISTSAGTVITSCYSAAYRTQIAVTTNPSALLENRMFTRAMNNSVWSAWKESVDSGTLTSTLTAYALKGANTDITSLTGITLNSTNGLSGLLSSNTADSTSVPSSDGTLIQPKIRLTSNAGAAAGIMALQGYSFTTGGFGSTLVGTRSYGAVGAHAAVAADRSVFTLVGAASDGTKYNPNGRIDFYTVNTQSGTNAGGEIRFLTTPVNSLVPTLAMTIRSNNDVAVVGALSAASLSLTTALPIASGGTGGTTAASARGSLQAVGYDAVTGSAPLPTGTTAQRTASPANGMIRYNSDTNEFEGYQNGGWAGIGGGNPLFTVLWWPSRVAIPAGYVAADGQTLTRTTYSAAWARVNAGDVPLATDAAWLSGSTYRGCYTAGNGSTTFRIPDLNGKTAGSQAAVFLRGDGLGSAGTPGLIQADAYQDHIHFRNMTGVDEIAYQATGGLYVDTGGGGTRQAVQTGVGGYTYSGSTFRTAAETRPTNATGTWVIKLIGGATAASQQDAAIGLAALEAKAYTRPNALGTVSQSAGVPTGALMEYGSNASGYYWKYAGGMMICKGTFTGYSGGVVVSLSFPIGFAGEIPTVSMNILPSTGYDADWTAWAQALTSLNFHSPNTRGANTVFWVAVGRWF